MTIEVMVYQCEKCHKHWALSYKTDECCKDKPEKKYTCRVCGCDTQEFRLICGICLNQERFSKATKVKYSEYEVGYLWDETKDEYFSGKEELEEKYYDDVYDEDLHIVPEIPTWCYGCIATPFSIDIDSAIERAEEDMYEDFEAEKDGINLKELRDYVQEWNEKQTSKSYDVDYKTVVLLNE